MTDAQNGPPDVGSVSEEAAKLFGAFSDWARESASGPGGEQVHEHLATGSTECTFCPWCRTVHAVRRTSPEVRAHLVTAASSLVQAAAGILATVVPDVPDEPAASHVERIDLDPDEDGAWPEDEA